MKKLIQVCLLLITVNLFASDYINVPLKDYVAVVSRINKINIAIDENIDHKITFLVSKNLNKKTYFEVLETLLKNKDMYLEKHNDFYMIKKVPVKEKQHTKEIIKSKDINSSLEIIEQSYNSIKLNYIDFKDIENFLKVYEDDIKYQFIHSSKILLLKSSKEDYNSIKKVINLIDKLPAQLKLKITILDTNLDKLKEFGAEHIAQIHNDKDTNYFFNLVAYPYTVSNDIPNTQKDKFYTFLKLINQNGNSKFVSSPILTLSDNKDIKFDVATTIPYTTGTTVIDEDDSKTTTAISYKDVGLKISAVPRIYNKNIVYLDLELEVSNIVSNSNNIPIVSKKYIKQSFYLESNNIFVLTGINQRETIKNSSGIPYLMDIPYLGWLFKSESTNTNNSNLSIFFEIVDNQRTIKHLKLDSSQYFEQIKTIEIDNNNKYESWSAEDDN